MNTLATTMITTSSPNGSTSSSSVVECGVEDDDSSGMNARGSSRRDGDGGGNSRWNAVRRSSGLLVCSVFVALLLDGILSTVIGKTLSHRAFRPINQALVRASVV